MTQNREITLIVQEAPVQDKGKDIARISWEIMEKLDLSRGDVIEIEGLYRTYAFVYPSSSQWADSIFIDGNIRRRAGIGIREQATIRKEVPKEAKKIEFQVIQEIEKIDLRELEDFLTTQLQGNLLFLGKDIAIPVESQGQDPFEELFRSREFSRDLFWNTSPSYIDIRITGTDPEGAVVPSDKTKFSVARSEKGAQKSSGKPSSSVTTESEPSQNENYLHDIHYEDIGGLDRELSQSGR